MKLSRTYAITLIILGIFAVSPFLYAYAAQYYRINNSLWTTVNEHGVCNKVVNDTGMDIFVPTNSAGEWTAFRNAVTPARWTTNCARCNPLRPGYRVVESPTCVRIEWNTSITDPVNCANYCSANPAATACQVVQGAGDAGCYLFSGGGCTFSLHWVATSQLCE